MKGTHWIGLALTLTWGCDPKDEDEQAWDSGGSTIANDTGNGGNEAGGEETGGDETGGDDTGGDETGGDETGGDETGGDETSGDETGGDETGGDEAGGDETGGEELVLPSGLNGTVITPPLAPTAFSALNLDGTRRDMDDLMDGPTVHLNCDKK